MLGAISFGSAAFLERLNAFYVMGCLNFTQLIPIIWPLAAESHLPLVQRYTFKNNVWVFIVTFYALWVWQIYFYKVQ